jgi:RecA/RadA recombinase
MVIKKRKQKKEKAKNNVDIDELRSLLKKDLVEMETNFDYFLTGNPMFDAYIGSGGLPKYQLEYFWASSSVGKSTLALQILAAYLKQVKDIHKNVILYFDTEESVTVSRMISLGIDEDIVDRVMVSNPNTIEDVKEIIQRIRAAYSDIELFIIWDTIAQTPSKEETEGYQKIGMQARSLTSLFRTTRFFESKLTMFALNQYREDLRENAKWMPKDPPGGNAVKHKSFVTMYANPKKSELIDVQFGRSVTFETIKSKVISPKRQMVFEFINTSGYDSILTAIGYFRTLKLIGKKSGGYYFFETDKDLSWRINDLYKFMLTDESIPKWKIIINEVFNNLYPDDDSKFIAAAKERIFNYYFENDKIHIDRFTSINKKLAGIDGGSELIDNVSSEKEIEAIIDKVEKLKEEKVK